VSTAVFSDLDRTLVYSASALMLDVPDAEAPRLLCVEVYDGLPLSYVTERAAAGVAALNEAGVLVPVTTRTPAQYRRIHLPGPAPKFAITANGGRLLRDGEEDLDYTAALADRLAGAGAPFDEIWAHVRGETDRDWVLRMRSAEDLFCYAVVDRAAMPAGWATELAGWCAERGWTVSVQGRKVYAVPTALSKAHAMHGVAATLGVTRTLAAGDSLLDGDLLVAADGAVRPAHGELHDTAFTRPGLRVTRSRGVAAGEEIVEWMLGEALGTPPRPVTTM